MRGGRQHQPVHTGMGTYWRLQIERKKRKKQRANHRYRRKHPSHKKKYGHRFVRNEAYAKNSFEYPYEKQRQVCKICGKDQ